MGNLLEFFSPLKAYSYYIKFGIIFAIALAVFGYWHHLTSTISDLNGDVARQQAAYNQLVIDSTARETSLKDIIADQNAKVTAAGEVYKSINDQLSVLIKSQKDLSVLHNKQFLTQQELLKNATIPTDCNGAIGYSVDYLINHKWPTTRASQ
jgi:hypothetical protein